MDLSYDAFKNGNNKKPSKPSASLSYDAFKNTKAVQADRSSRISQGLPVSVNKDKSTPTFVGNIIRGLGKDALTILSRPTQLVEALKGKSVEQQTVHSNYFGDIAPSQNTKDVVKDVGRGLSLVSNGIGVGAIKNIGANALKETALQVAKRTAIEGLAAGFVGGAGSGIAEGQNGKQLLGTTLKGAGIGGVLGGLIGGAGAKLFGGKAAKSAEELANVRAFGSAARPDVPAMGVPPEGYVQPKPPAVTRGTLPNQDKVNYEPYTPDNQLPTIQMGGKPTSKLPTVQIGEPTPTKMKGDFTYHPDTGEKIQSFHPDTGVPIVEKPISPKAVVKDVGTKGSFDTKMTESPKLTQETVKTPKGTEVPKVTVGEPIKAKQRTILKDIPNENTTFHPKEAQMDFYNEDPERAFRIATGKEKVPTGINPHAMYRLAANDAKGEAALTLANSKLPYTAGANLSMHNVGDRSNSIVETIREANTHLKKNLNSTEAKKAMTELADEIKRSSPTKADIHALIDEITC